ncbi:MAG: hypothetical protein IJH54_08040, partial [Clostridia bacterium]|nr:hypothetical protein [Clostridia bacterium]
MKDGKQSGAWAASNGAKDYSLATIGNLEAEAVVTETICAKMDGVSAFIEGGETKILALCNAVSSGVGSAPGSLRAIDGGRSNVSAKMGTKDARQSVRVEINGKANDTGIWSKNGFFRMLSADQDEINDCALRGLDLPQGRITEGLRGKNSAGTVTSNAAVLT